MDMKNPISELLIPHELSNDTGQLPLFESHQRRFSHHRAELVKALSHGLRLGASAADVQLEETYAVVLSPEAQGLFREGVDGFYSGVVRTKDGAILEHARMRKVPPKVAKLAATCCAQVLLLQISAKLDELDANLDLVKRYLHNDRIASIRAGMNQFEQAIRVKDDMHRKKLLSDTVGMLNTGVTLVLESLPTEIAEAPTPGTTLGGNWPHFSKDKIEETEQKLRRAENSMRTCIRGLKTLAQAYAALDEHEVGFHSVAQYLRELSEAPILQARDKARLLEYQGVGNSPEDFWCAADRSLRELGEKLSASGCFRIELSGSELKEIAHE